MIEEFFRGRPAAFAALALAFGIAGDSLVEHASYWFPAGVFLVLLGSGILFWRRSSIRIAFLFAAFAILGYALMSLDNASVKDTPLARIASMKPSKIILTGTITAIDETNSGYRWSFDADSLALPNAPTIPAMGTVLLRLSNVGDTTVALPEEGSHLRVYCSLEPFHAPSNPHEFASDQKLQSVTYTEAIGYIHSRFDYGIAGKAGRAKVGLESPTYAAATYAVRRLGNEFQAIHRNLLGLIDTALSGTSLSESNARGFVEAVVLGDRSDMDKETLNDFTTAGVAHILAVSGFNVAIVALVVAQLLRLFGIYWHRTRLALTMAMVLLYSAMVGFQPSVVRALIMIELYLLAHLLERKGDPLNIVMSAAAINLLFRPQDLFDVGFQLSYAGVLGMILIAPKIRWLWGLTEDRSHPIWNNNRFLHTKWVKNIANTSALSVGASLASYPVIAAHFYRISFIGLLANLPLIPLSAVITAYGFLLIPITALSYSIGQIYGSATTYMTDMLLWLTHFSAHVPSAARAAASPSWIFLAMLFLSLVFVLGATTRARCVGRISMAGSAFFAMYSIGVPFSNSVLAPNESKLQVLFFDVGQGDCMLLHTPADKNYFIDFGRIDRDGNANIERTAIPFLRAEDITQIDAGFISHMHTDHFGGAPALVENVRVDAMMTSGERVGNTAARTLDSITRVQHIQLHILARGDTLHLDSEITLFVLHPDRHAPTAERTAFGQNIHGGMLVFKIVYRNTSFLFLGDLEREEEQRMMADYGNFLESNVVKVAHHGSYTSSTPEFVSSTSPDYAVISVGEHNLFGHPSPAIVRRWERSTPQVCRTDLDGAILLASDGQTVERINW